MKLEAVEKAEQKYAELLKEGLEFTKQQAFKDEFIHQYCMLASYNVDVDIMISDDKIILQTPRMTHNQYTSDLPQGVEKMQEIGSVTFELVYNSEVATPRTVNYSPSEAIGDKYIKKRRQEDGEYFFKYGVPCLQVEKNSTVRYDYFDTRKMSDVLQTETSILYDGHQQIQLAVLNSKANVTKYSDFIQEQVLPFGNLDYLENISEKRQYSSPSKYSSYSYNVSRIVPSLPHVVERFSGTEALNANGYYEKEYKHGYSADNAEKPWSLDNLSQIYYVTDIEKKTGMPDNFMNNEEVWDKIDELQSYYNDLEDSHTL